jgi:16S rRNA (uracil1498-N3)-methyltransferase
VFVDDVDRPELDPGDRHHLQRVLRVRPGDVITVSDGAGAWRSAAFGESLAPLDVAGTVARATPRITVGFALVKGGRPELVTQKLTELGVDVVVPFVADRSVVKWEGGRDERHIGRLRRVAREAAMQSRRCHLPAVENVARYVDLVDQVGTSVAARHGEPPTLDRPAILIGPEGGWSSAELDRASYRVGLGDLVLRAETAAITAAGLLCGLRSGLVLPVGIDR